MFGAIIWALSIDILAHTNQKGRPLGLLQTQLDQITLFVNNVCKRMSRLSENHV